MGLACRKALALLQAGLIFFAALSHLCAESAAKAFAVPFLEGIHPLPHPRRPEVILLQFGLGNFSRGNVHRAAGRVEYRRVYIESHQVGSSRRFGKIRSEILHTCSMSPCQPVIERWLSYFFFFLPDSWSEFFFFWDIPAFLQDDKLPSEKKKKKKLR